MNLWRKSSRFWEPISIAKNSNKEIYRPFIYLVTAYLPGVLLGASFPGYIPAALLLCLLSTGLILYFIKRKRSAILWPLIFFFSLGYVSIQPWVSSSFAENHITRFADGSKHLLTGVVDDRPKVTGKKTRFVLRVEKLGQTDTSIPVQGRIRITARGDAIPLHKGDRIILRSKIRPIHNFNNPGGFDYVQYMAFKKIWVTGYTGTKKIRFEKGGVNDGKPALLQHLREGIAGMIAGLTFSNPDRSKAVKAVMKALLIGDRDGLTPHVRDMFNRSGTSHLLAISGLHIGIVAGTAFFIFQWMLAFCKPLLWIGRTRTAAAILSFVPVLVYGLVAGMSPSTQRAIIMVAVFLLTYLFNRDHDLINTAAVAALIIVVVHPPTLFSISFQLSFTAVLSIVYGFANLVRKKGNTNGPWHWITAKLWTLFLVSVFAILGTLPLVMHYFNQISFVGVAVNVIAVPLIGFLVVPLGLASVLLSFFSQSLAVVGFYVCGYVLSLTMVVIDFCAGLPFAAVKTVTPNPLEISCYYILMWGIVSLASRGKANFQLVSSPRWVKAVVLAAVVVLAADIVYWINERFITKDLRITVIDVGQGSAALLELPGGVNLLADGGGFSDNSVFDVGARIVAPYLWHRKIMTIDGIVLSHPNSDHMNGLTYIAEHFNVKHAWTNNESAGSKGFRTFSKTLERKGIDHPDYKDLLRFYTINGVTLEILYPEKHFLGRRDAEPWRNANNNSLVMKASYGRHSFLFPGDIMADGEGRIVELEPDALESSVLVAPHHGSRSSSSIAFLKRVDPEIVVVSAGWRNRFKFPHQDVLKRYADMGSRVFRTDLDGAVCMVSDGETLTVETVVRHVLE